MDQSSASPVNPAVETLITNINNLMNEAEQMLNDSTSHHAEDQVELLRTRDQYDTLQVHFAAFCASAGRTIADGARQADRTIRDHPYRSLVLALGVGALLGAVCARNNS